MATNNAQTFTIGGVTHQVEDTTARAGVASLQTALASLQSALDTLMGTDDITDEIDTYNEIKEFLDGFDVNDPNLSEQLTTLFTNVNDLVAAMPNKASATQVNNLQTAVTNLQTALAGKVDAVNGKGLSTNDYTDTEKTKLEGIAPGAQVNVINGIQTHDGQSLTPVNGVVTLPESGGGDVTGVKVNSSTTVEPDANGVVDISEAMAGKQDALNSSTTLATLNGTALHFGDSVTIQGQQGPQGEQGPAGPQGNSGVASADGIESVNNLNGGTTDTAEKVYVLGANMGKELGDRLSVLEGVETYGPDATLDHADKYVHTNGNYWTANGYSLSRKILLKAGQTINVHVTGGAANSCVIVLSENSTEEGGYKPASGGSIPYVSGTTDYSYPITPNTNDIYVAIGYKTADGFTATINTGSQMMKNKNSIETMLERLGGVEIPFKSTIGYYQYANDTLTEITGTVANGYYHTEPIPLSSYKALLFKGIMSKDSAYFCAVFFDSNGDYLSRGLLSRKTYYGRLDAMYDMYNVLDEAPNGAASVVLQSDTRNTGAKVIGFTDYPYSFFQNKWWKFDYYGIKGDGVADDTEALQMLIYSSDGDVELKPGRYLISSALHVNTKYIRKIVGNGSTIIIDADNYASGSDVLGFDIYGDHTGSADPNKTSEQMFNSGFVIEDVHITSKTGLAWHDNQTGSSVGKGTAIKLDKTSMVTIRGCQIYAVNDGIELFDKNRNTIIDGCFIYNCWDSGILFGDTSDLHQINIVGCHISYCKTLIFLDNPNQINNYQISGCDLECAYGWPYGVTEGTKCCIKMVSKKMIMIGQVEITGNTIQAHANRDDGGVDAEYLIDIESLVDNSNRQATYTSIVGNHMSNVGRYAIRINGGDQYTIAGNTVGNTGGSATNQNELTGGLLYLEGTVSDIAVTGNTLRNHYSIVKDAYMVNVDEDANVTRLAVTGNVGTNTPINIDGASQDYISVVGNCLGGGAVTIGTATHKQEANNI